MRRRTRVIRILPNAAIRLRLVRALAVETYERLPKENCYPDIEDPREQRKEALR